VDREEIAPFTRDPGAPRLTPMPKQERLEEPSMGFRPDAASQLPGEQLRYFDRSSPSPRWSEPTTEVEGASRRGRGSGS
jgi:hypothetical protein